MTAAGTHTVIVGAGAIGTMLAVRLHCAGHRVTLVGRPGSPAETRHLCLRHDDREASATLPSIPVDTAAPPDDAVVCVCVKAHSTAAVAEAGSALLRAARLIISAQNGAGNIEQLAGASPSPLVLAPPGFGATRDGDAVRLHGISDCACAAVPPASDDAARLWANWLTAAGLPATVHANWKTVLWLKLIVNAAVNPLTALHTVCNGVVAERDDLRDHVAAIVDETLPIAAAEGAELPSATAVIERVMTVCRATATNRSSMLADVLAHRPTEIEQITGHIVATARRHGIPCPVNASLQQPLTRPRHFGPPGGPDDAG